MKTNLRTLALMTALIWMGSALAQPLQTEDPEKDQLTASETEVIEDYDLEKTENGNWIDNGMDYLLLESEIYLIKRNVSNRINTLLCKLGVELADNQIIIHW